MRRGTRCGWIQHEGGATATEFALILPVFTMLVFATFEVGQAIYMRASVQWALDRAARVLAVDPDTTPGEVEAALNSYLVTAGAPDVEVTQVTETWAQVPVVRIRARYDHLVEGPFLPTFTLNFDFETLVPQPEF